VWTLRLPFHAGPRRPQSETKEPDPGQAAALPGTSAFLNSKIQVVPGPPP